MLTLLQSGWTRQAMYREKKGTLQVLVFSKVYESIRLDYQGRLAQSDALLTGNQEVSGSISWSGFFREMAHGIFSIIILSFLLIKEGSCQLLVKE